MHISIVTPTRDTKGGKEMTKKKIAVALIGEAGPRTQKGDTKERRGVWRILNDDEVRYMHEKTVAESIASLKAYEVRVLVMPNTGRKVLRIAVPPCAIFAKERRVSSHAEATSPQVTAYAMRAIIRAAKKEQIRHLICDMPPHTHTNKNENTNTNVKEEIRNQYEVAASNAMMADFDFTEYKTPSTEGGAPVLQKVEYVLPEHYGPREIKEAREGIRRGIIIGEETNACRRLQNMPGGDMTPQVLAAHAVAAAKKTGTVSARVLTVTELRRLKMGGVLGVGKGSAVPPRFIILEYYGGKKTDAPTVLVGKGVTFDTGGLNLKPSEHIYEMHMDMSGGAAVIHTLIAAARIGVHRTIIALVPAVENMPSGSSYRPGDLLRTMNGKTIEVLNTDAEGRVILADALEYAKRYRPALVVDVATLTGAAMVALGLRYTGLFTTDTVLEERFRALGDATVDPVWPLPLSKAYEKDIKGTFADWANAGKPGAGGGASTAAAFLWQFTKDKKGESCYPWVHLDIAPRMTSIEEEYLAQGGLGTPVRLLARLLEEA